MTRLAVLMRQAGHACQPPPHVAACVTPTETPRCRRYEPLTPYAICRAPTMSYRYCCHHFGVLPRTRERRQECLHARWPSAYALPLRVRAASAAGMQHAAYVTAAEAALQAHQRLLHIAADAPLEGLP